MLCYVMMKALENVLTETRKKAFKDEFCPVVNYLIPYQLT